MKLEGRTGMGKSWKRRRLAMVLKNRFFLTCKSFSLTGGLTGIFVRTLFNTASSAAPQISRCQMMSCRTQDLALTVRRTGHSARDLSIPFYFYITIYCIHGKLVSRALNLNENMANFYPAKLKKEILRS